jgi:hypothetical protein
MMTRRDKSFFREPDARVLTEDEWARVGAKGFGTADIFAAYLNTRRFRANGVTVYLT